MLTKTKCWFESYNLIVPKLKEQYILKKDLSYEYRDKSQCEFVKGMVFINDLMKNNFFEKKESFNDLMKNKSVDGK